MENSWKLNLQPYKDGGPVTQPEIVNKEGGLNLKNDDPDSQKGFVDFVKKMSTKVKNSINGVK